MGAAPFAESISESLATRLYAARSVLARQWLEQLNEILPVDRRDVFPGEHLLDHIPQLIEEIAGYLRAPETEAIAANTAVMSKAAELGLLRYSQRASVHQLLREYHLLGTLLERFITEAVTEHRPGGGCRWRTPGAEPRRAMRARIAAADRRYVRQQIFRND